MRKKFKTSKRGLTFSLEPEDISVGTKFRYVIDTKRQQVLIIPDENGPLKVSRKQSGRKIKPLFDLRSKEVVEAIAGADYLEVEVQETQIVVYTHRRAKARFSVLKGKQCSVSDILGVSENIIYVPMNMAAGQGCDINAISGWVQSVSYENNMCLGSTDTTATELSKVYDVVSLFSGAGLFDKAWLEGGRFRFVYANDFCKDVLATYRYNIGSHITCKDIRDIEPEELPFADVFSTSPCCQAFSNANRRNMNSKEAEKKRLLVEEVVRLVNGVPNKPKVVVVENVPEMITKEHGLYIDKLLQGLSDYDASVQVVCDYKVGGFTGRRRCVVILSSIGKIELPQIEVLPYKTVKDALSKVNAEWFNYNDYSIPKPETVEKMSYVPQGGNWTSIPNSVYSYRKCTHSNVMRRLAWDEVAPTIANVRKDNMMPPEGNRCLSISEAAALMGLGKDFHFIGELASKQQMLANGVTQAIGKLVKNTVLRALDAWEFNRPVLV